MKGELSISNWYLGDPKQTQLGADPYVDRLHPPTTRTNPSNLVSDLLFRDLITENEVDDTANLSTRTYGLIE